MEWSNRGLKMKLPINILRQNHSSRKLREYKIAGFKIEARGGHSPCGLLKATERFKTDVWPQIEHKTCSVSHPDLLLVSMWVVAAEFYFYKNLGYKQFKLKIKFDLVH